MIYPDIFTVLNFKQADSEIKTIVKDFHSFLHCSFTNNFDESLRKNEDLIYSISGNLWHAFFVIKDNLRASEILFHLNFFEQASSQLRIAYEVLIKAIARIENCIVKNKNGINMRNTIENVDKEIKPSKKLLYEFYKDLCGPIHDPATSVLDNSYEGLPMEDSKNYDAKKFKARLLLFINVICDLIISTALYHQIKIDPREMKPFEGLFNEETKKRLSDLEI